MKVCRECKKNKPLIEFYKHKQMADGHLNKCIECVKSRVTKHRNENIERFREYDKSRSLLPHRVKARQEYQKTENGKIAIKKARISYIQRYPMKRAAHVIVGNAIRDGKLIAEKLCSVCKSSINIEAHHDDYTKPLDVRWLCKKCHIFWHKNNQPIYQ